MPGRYSARLEPAQRTDDLGSELRGGAEARRDHWRRPRVGDRAM